MTSQLPAVVVGEQSVIPDPVSLQAITQAPGVKGQFQNLLRQAAAGVGGDLPSSALVALQKLIAALIDRSGNTLSDNSPPGQINELLETTSGTAKLAKLLQKLFSGLTDQSGNTLPDNLPLGQIIKSLQTPSGTAKLTKALPDNPSAQDNAATGQIPPELLDLLKVLLGVAGQGADTGGGSGDSPAPADVNTQTASASLSQLLLNNTGNNNAGTGTPDRAQTKLIGAETGRGNQVLSMEAAYLRQILSQVQDAKNSTADDSAAVTAYQGDGTATDGTFNPGDFIAKLTAVFSGPDARTALERVLAAVELNSNAVKLPADTAGSQNSGSQSSAFSGAFVNQPLTVQSPAVQSPVLSNPVPFNQPGWDQALGQNVLWMARNDVQVASMRLNPPHLGPLEVRVSFNQDQANVSFFSHHAVVREALEAALPRLREMFGQGGINLANVDVSGGSSSGQHTTAGSQGGPGQGQGDPGSAASTRSDGGLVAGEQAPVGAAPLPLGLVDFFA